MYFEIVKEKIKDLVFSHFLYLEDDILVNEPFFNIKYWISTLFSKKLIIYFFFYVLKFNLNDNEKYIVDSTKNKRANHKIYNKQKDFAFEQI